KSRRKSPALYLKTKPTIILTTTIDSKIAQFSLNQNSREKIEFFYFFKLNYLKYNPIQNKKI
ncbi:MAG: hypothetical protein NWS90_09875, partial [Algoriphagus sp.]|nr:hypothetical protein [Algoriphagus sp.]MDP4748749.1 hypothetical protein [Algoriphagus sp.]